MTHEQRNVLVTGATGFTGGHLARALQQHGHRVRALVRDPACPAAQALEQEGIEIVAGDLAHRADIRQAVRGSDDVYHIAALYRQSRHPDAMYHRINAEGPRHIVEAARDFGCRRVIHCSTAGVHGAVDRIPADEQAPFNPGDIYQRTKLEGERVVREAIDAGLPGVIFRPGGIYGPGDLRFLKLFRTIYRGQFRIFGSGQVYYHPTYIDDLVAGIMRCGEADEALGQTYILAGPRYVTITEMAEAAARAMDVRLPGGRLPITPLKAAAAACEAICRPLRIEAPLHRRRLDFFLNDRAFTSAKALREIGFAPAVDVDEGMRRTAAWYVQQGYLPSTASVAACECKSAVCAKERESVKEQECARG